MPNLKEYTKEEIEAIRSKVYKPFDLESARMYCRDTITIKDTILIADFPRKSKPTWNQRTRTNKMRKARAKAKRAKRS
jgi:hypothetical protein